MIARPSDTVGELHEYWQPMLPSLFSMPTVAEEPSSPPMDWYWNHISPFSFRMTSKVMEPYSQFCDTW